MEASSAAARPHRRRFTRIRGGGGCGSKPSVDADDEPFSEAPRIKSESAVPLVKLPSKKDAFASDSSPLFKEYLTLLGDELGGPASVGDISETDALLVIDMQRDFVPKSASNMDGGRFGVAEGDHVDPLCCQLIKHFAKCGGHVVATRDYHPCDHISFMGQNGPFPAHCVQGTPGSYFLPSIASALAAAKTAGGKVDVAFKGMHEDIDSFGGLPYYDGGNGRLQKADSLAAEAALGVCMGCDISLHLTLPSPSLTFHA